MEKKLRKKITLNPSVLRTQHPISVWLALFVSDFTDAAYILSKLDVKCYSFTELISIGDLNKYLIFERKKNTQIVPFLDVFPPFQPIAHPTS